MSKYINYVNILVLGFLCSCDSYPLDKRLKKHVYYLASDSLHGRETGTQYELMAASYIKNEFMEIGLKPMGTNHTFYQDYKFLAGRKLSKNNHLIINGVELEINKDYIPLNFSSNGTIEGKSVHMGYSADINQPEFANQSTNSVSENKILLIEISKPDGTNGITSWWKYLDLRDRVEIAENQGARAVVFYTFGSIEADIKTYFDEKINPVLIPSILVTNPDRINSESSNFIDLKVEYNEDRKMGRNVIGMIDNGAENTVIIASHHDGLGHGGFSDSIENSDIIYNGADDAASGTSVLIEYARWIKNHKMSNYNYLFISFSGEELGILGSMYFTNNPTIKLDRATCMISLDHIGRMNASDKEIIIYGVGTSPSWNEMLNDLQIFDVSMIRYESGIGLTDYTSFYLKNIPVLGFNTGMHEDFHSPLDEAEKINYNGMKNIFDILTQIDSSLTSAEKLEFTSTIEIDPIEIQKFILRYVDYSFEGTLN
jgi:Peptidase family M28